ncbi:CLUMA_CG021647, isoform A [Clunio marinus]|uniref:CLUMA_CG021647, isoform A n=1 Tax=Clunio marinus TaxID=568069 RepID=A0A1J1J9I8_9DIPT|nr:CLUMA_CG021647, isoform A [Clunio marinus]
MHRRTRRRLCFHNLLSYCVIVQVESLKRKENGKYLRLLQEIFAEVEMVVVSKMLVVDVSTNQRVK